MQAANPPTSNRLQEQLTRLPLMWFSLAFLAGIVLAKLVSLPTSVRVPPGGEIRLATEWIWVGLSILFLVPALFTRFFPPLVSLRATLPSHPSAFLPSTLLRASLHPFTFVLLFALFLGAARYQLSVPDFDANHIAFYNDRDYDLLIAGTVVEPPDYRDNYTNLRLDVEKVDTGDRDLIVHGLILVRATNNQEFHYGDRLRLRGKLQTPPENEDFSYRDYLAAQHIHSYMSSGEVTVLPGKGGNPISTALYTVKDRSLDNIYRMFPD